MKIKSKIFFVISSIALIISLFLTCVDLNGFNRNFYKTEYTKLNTASSMGMSQESLDKTTEVLLDYIQNKRDNIDIIVEVNGFEREVFNEKEKLHMIDVQVLYENAMNVRNILFIVFLVSLLIGVYIDKKNSLKNYSRSFLQSIAIVFSFLFAISFYAIVDFDSFWIRFHYIFFTNDLFFLDPTTDLLIQMVPSQFFFDLVFKTVVSFVLIMALLSVICFYLRRRENDKRSLI